MNMPQFTAKYSLYQSPTQYYHTNIYGDSESGSEVVPVALCGTATIQGEAIHTDELTAYSNAKGKAWATGDFECNKKYPGCRAYGFTFDVEWSPYNDCIVGFNEDGEKYYACYARGEIPCYIDFEFSPSPVPNPYPHLEENQIYEELKQDVGGHLFINNCMKHHPESQDPPKNAFELEFKLPDTETLIPILPLIFTTKPSPPVPPISPAEISWYEKLTKTLTGAGQTIINVGEIMITPLLMIMPPTPETYPELYSDPNAPPQA